MTILVLGAVGNTGREVVSQLKQNSFYCKVFVKDKALAEPFHLSSSHIFEGDFNDVESLTHAMEGIHSVYFAMPAHPNNETWTRNVLQAMSAQHVNHLVKLSGLGANAQSGSSIIRTHALTDELVKASGINYTLLQPNSFFKTYSGISTQSKPVKNSTYLSLRRNRA
ncbi:SDR family oxidoreductase [Vibrio agarilyticus]|uniref:SDR family oxidoreductase n=1 Tax=Vibrio agarilyticus TaxID=2726741 RepID=UPI001FE92C0B|nr:NAD(P)H-binding protein [Vibrio agarilyticus]